MGSPITAARLNPPTANGHDWPVTTAGTPVVLIQLKSRRHPSSEELTPSQLGDSAANPTCIESEIPQHGLGDDRFANLLLGMGGQEQSGIAS